MALSIAFSPCPNDTFVFHALVHGLVPGAPELDVTYADVDVTNTAAQAKTFDIVKVSYAALPWLMDDYELLPCGGALGRGCGPLLLTRDRKDLDGARVAVPGDRTTAYLLFRFWAEQRGLKPKTIDVVPFHRIMPGVADGTYDAGLVIHEARFTYPRHGLKAMVDLGEWWEGDTGLPIPLGAILAKRDTVDPAEATSWIRSSVEHAHANPDASRAFIREHAQEMEPDVADRHIALYVNEFTDDVGAEGRKAIATLLDRAAAQGLTPQVSSSRATAWTS